MSSSSACSKLGEMLAESVDAQVTIDATRALNRVLEAFSALGYPQEVVAQWSIPAADAADLIAGLRKDLKEIESPRILEVGTFVGTSALVMLLTIPNAVVHSVDPNFPLEVEFDAMHCAHRDADLKRTTQEVASLAAEHLGVRDRLHLHEGGFSTDATFAGTARNATAIGEKLAQQYGPFDAAFVDGLHFEQTVFSDARLAARSMTAQGSLYFHDVIGYWGSTVRRALSRFLELNPSFTLSHPPYRELYRSVGRISRRSVPADTTDARMTHCFGTHGSRFAEYVARAMATQLPALTAESLDAFSRSTVDAMGHTLGATSCGVLLAGIDEWGDDDASERLRDACTSRDALLLGATPPGEAHAASAWSVPLARRVAQLNALDFDAFDLVTSFLEPFSYALGDVCVLPRASSFLLNTVFAVRRSTALHEAVLARGHLPLDLATARALESARLQQIHDHSALRRSQGETEFAHGETIREIAQHKLVCELHASQLAHVSARLQWYLDWRIHIGRHRFLKSKT